jgi:hypothetical protein
MKKVLSTRVLAVGLTATLTAGGVVATTATSAEASAGTYTCTLPVLGDVGLPFDVAVPGLPTDLPTGHGVPAGVPVTVTSLLPAGAFGVLDGLGFDALSSPDFALDLDGVPVPVPDLGLDALTGDLMSGGTLSAVGSTDTFVPPLPGNHDLSMPSAFTLVPSVLGVDLAPISCVTDAPVVIDVVHVVKQSSSTHAKNRTPRIVKGKRARISAAVTRQFADLGEGAIRVKRGKKVIGSGVLDSGSTVVTTQRFRKVGRYTLTVRYLGDQLTQPSFDKVTIRVRRHR